MPDLTVFATMAFKVLLLASLVEGLVEYFLIPLIEPLRGTKGGSLLYVGGLDLYQLLARYSAGVVAILLCFSYGIDLLAQLGFAGPFWVGAIATGLILGRGSNFVHDFVSRWLTVPT